MNQISERVEDIFIQNSKEYKEGHDAWDYYCDSGWEEKPSNPYEYGSDRFKRWNRGWNSNYKGVKEARKNKTKI